MLGKDEYPKIGDQYKHADGRWSLIRDRNIHLFARPRRHKFRRRVTAPAASGAAGTEPVAWGYAHPNGTLAFASVQEPEPGTPAIVPLYAAPHPAPGWLTKKDREWLTYLLQNFPTSSRVDEWIHSLLARSSPPQVVPPEQEFRSHSNALRDAEWFAALAAAGVTCKEVG